MYIEARFSPDVAKRSSEVNVAGDLACSCRGLWRVLQKDVLSDRQLPPDSHWMAANPHPPIFCLSPLYLFLCLAILRPYSTVKYWQFGGGGHFKKQEKPSLAICCNGNKRIYVKNCLLIEQTHLNVQKYTFETIIVQNLFRLDRPKFYNKVQQPISNNF